MGNQKLQAPPELPIAAADHSTVIAVADRERPAKPHPGVTREEFEAKQLTKRRAQNEARIAIENSFPAKIRELLVGAELAHFEGLASALAADCEAHAAMISKTRAQLTGDIEMVAKALNEAAESGDYTSVVGAAESVRFDKTGLAQAALKIWADGLALATRIEAALKPLPGQLSAELENVVADVKRKLSDIGSGFEAQPAYENNRDTAEKTFDYQARWVNSRSRAAHAKAQDARATWEAAFEQKNRCVRGREAAHNYLNQTVLKVING
jgi:hypothetical protein